MRRKKAAIKTDGPTIKELSSIIGEVRLLQDENREMFYEVRVENILLEGCNLKAEVTILKGMGKTTVCCGDLFTAETAKKWVDDRTTQELIDADVREATSGYYSAERRASFVKFLEKVCPKKELTMITEELGGSLKKAADHQMKNIARRVAVLHRTGKTEEAESEY